MLLELPLSSYYVNFKKYSLTDTSTQAIMKHLASNLTCVIRCVYMEPEKVSVGVAHRSILKRNFKYFRKFPTRSLCSTEHLDYIRYKQDDVSNAKEIITADLPCCSSRRDVLRSRIPSRSDIPNIENTIDHFLFDIAKYDTEIDTLIGLLAASRSRKEESRDTEIRR